MKVTLDISESAIKKLRNYYSVQCLLDAGEGSGSFNIGLIMVDKVLQAVDSGEVITVKTKEDK